MENLNSPEYLERTKIQLLEILRDVEPVPGAQIQTGQIESQTNPRNVLQDNESEEEDDPDQRPEREERKEHQSELVG
jgi:histone deacetylase 1/2